MSNFWQSYGPVKINISKTLVAKVQAKATSKLHVGFEIPPFSISPLPWLEASYITLEFDFHAESDYSLAIPINPPAVNTNFCLAVRWGSPENPTRYKLWEHVGEDLDYPLYNGEIISKDATYEIWSTTSDTTSLTNPFLLVTSLLVPVDSCCNTYDVVINTYITSRCELFAPSPFVFNPLFSFRKDCLEDIILGYGGGYGWPYSDGIGYMYIQPYGAIPPFVIREDPHPTGEGVGAIFIGDDDDDIVIL